MCICVSCYLFDIVLIFLIKIYYLLQNNEVRNLLMFFFASNSIFDIVIFWTFNHFNVILLILRV